MNALAATRRKFEIAGLEPVLARSVTVLGSTGSIGDSALKVVRAFRGDFKVVGLSTESNIAKLAEQIQEFKATHVGVVNSKACAEFVGTQRKSANLKIYSGTESLQKLVVLPGVDLVLSGVVGAVGLPALLAALF